jgi:hypothetical protein
VVPLFIEEVDYVPYGLAIRHSIRLEGNESFKRAATELLTLLSQLKSVPGDVEIPRSGLLAVPSPSRIAELVPGRWKAEDHDGEAILRATVFPGGEIEVSFNAGPNAELSTRTAVAAFKGLAGGLRARWWLSSGRLFVQLQGSDNQTLTHLVRFLMSLFNNDESNEFMAAFEPVEVDVSRIGDHVVEVAQTEFRRVSSL